MATAKFPVPNWSQAILAERVGLDPNDLAVRMEDERSIWYLRHTDRKEFMVNKIDGSIREY